MPDQSVLEALRDIFWPVYLAALVAGAVGFSVTRRWCLGRAVIAMALGSLAMAVWVHYTGGSLSWWQHMVIDVPVFAMLTMPPRHYWQATLAAMVLAQIVLHAVWGMAPDLARIHWLGSILLGFAKCAILLLWSGGSSVENLLGHVARWAFDLVHPPARGELAG